MDQYEHIRTAHRVYGKKIRAIARDTGHSKNTIKKALRGEFCPYTTRESQPYPVLGPYLEIIDEWLRGDKEQPTKQRHTAHRVYTRLVEEHDFDGSESTVRRYVREAKARLGLNGQTAFIPLDPAIGREVEVDWGKAVVIINGVRQSIKYFCMRSKYSGKHFVRCYPCERQQAFLDGHLHGFEFFGGIFKVHIYDNLTSAVRKVLRGRNREEQESFLKFRAYYTFTADFCNVAQGHEKGGIEGLVGYIRRNYLVPVPEAATLAELNHRLLEQCLSYGEHRIHGREQTVNALFAEERDYLLRLPAQRFSNVQTVRVKVDKYSTARADRNHYSVPTNYVGFHVEALLSMDTVTFSYQRKKLACHERVYERNRWVLNPMHYLKLIRQRPRSFESARPLKSWRKEWPPCLESLLTRFCDVQGENKGIKDFITVLLLYQEYAADEIEAAVELALDRQLSSSEGVKHLLRYCQPEAAIKPLSTWSCLPLPDVSVYGQLHGETERGTQMEAEAEAGAGAQPGTFAANTPGGDQ